MEQKIHFEDIEHKIRETLDMGKNFKISPNGSSMLPLIVQGRDHVYIKKPEGRLKKYDIAFFKRDDGKFILHRVVRVKKNSYVMCGDNQVIVEWPVRADQIIGIADEFTHKGKTTKCSNILYRTYAALWSILRPYRLFMLKLYRKIIITKRWFSN